MDQTQVEKLRKCVLEMVVKFKETGSVFNKKRKVEKHIRNEGTVVDVLGHVVVDRTLIIRKIARYSGINRRSAAVS